MKRTGFPLLFIALQLVSCQGRSYTLTGTVSDGSLEGQTVYLMSYNMDSSEFVTIDSAVVERQLFRFEGEAGTDPDVRFIGLKPDEWPVMVILEKGDIQVTIDSLSKTVRSGSPLNETYQELQSRNDSLQLIMEQLQDSVTKAHKKGALTLTQFEVYQKQLQTLNDDYQGGLVRFIVAQASNGVGRYLFRDNYWWMNAPQLRQVVDAFSGDVPKFKKFDDMAGRVQTLESTWEGKPYTDIQGLDLNGKPVKLSGFVGKNKVIVLDFWASWCGPCRAKMPFMRELYKKYHAKGLEIVGVSLDKDAQAWRDATKQESITWPQFSNLQGWKEPSSIAYGVNSIPHLVVIDQKGTIISREPDNLELDFLLKKLLD